MDKLNFKLECEDYRTLVIPNTENKNVKLGTLFAKVEELPEELVEWMKVNPRNPKYTKGGKLSGAVSRSIVKTLQDEPEIFSLKNLGIYILVDEVQSKRLPGDKHTVEISLSDPKIHGIVNGGHTFSSIRQVLDLNTYKSGAFVRLHLYMNVPSEDIVQLAEGLNKNLQVDDRSLENLQGSFEKIKNSMKGKKGFDQIAYKDGDDGSIDILEVLHLLSLLDLNKYSNNRHPNDIFGNKKKVLGNYSEDIKRGDGKSSFMKLIPFTYEILKLSEEIQKGAVEYLCRNKVNNKTTGNRVGSVEHKRDALFIEGEIGGLIHQGWLYPMVSAFRANLKQTSWEEGKLEWLVEPKILIAEIIKDMATNIKELNNYHKSKPAEVGRQATTYQVCFSYAFTALAMKGKIAITS